MIWIDTERKLNNFGLDLEIRMDLWQIPRLRYGIIGAIIRAALQTQALPPG